MIVVLDAGSGDTFWMNNSPFSTISRGGRIDDNCFSTLLIVGKNFEDDSKIKFIIAFKILWS